MRFALLFEVGSKSLGDSIPDSENAAFNPLEADPRSTVYLIGILPPGIAFMLKTIVP
jgi:hypothetical protein